MAVPFEVHQVMCETPRRPPSRSTSTRALASDSLTFMISNPKPNVSGRGKGTFHVRVVVDVPRKLTKEQKKLAEQLGKTMPIEKLEPTAPGAERDKPFFERVKDLFG